MTAYSAYVDRKIQRLTAENLRLIKRVAEGLEALRVTDTPTPRPIDVPSRKDTP